MANVTETARWETGVYQIEKSDKVLGGAEGKVNVQAQQLANRTAYLKQQVETKANKTDLTNGLNGKANSSHAHAWGEITGKPSTFTPASHTHTMANITDLAAAMNAKANLASPTFTGSPKAPTPAQTVNDATIATTAFVKAAIAALVGSAPEALDTLEELSNALANDANLKQTLLTEIGKKANASHNHTMSQITDFELKQLSTEDLDSIKKTGFYKQDNNSNATTARHYPENKAGVLEVYPSVYGYMQVYRIYDNLRVYARNMASNGTWGNWARLDGRDKANVSSPTFTGIPRTTTPTSNASDEQIANVGFVKSAIAALVGSAPATLDTLAEIATALSNDENLKQTLLNEIGKRAPLNHNHEWSNINNKPATATRWPNSTEQGFTQSIGENGWVKLPNGLILQWGQLTVYYESVKDYLFNLAFPQRCCAVLVSNSINSGLLATLGTLKNNGRESNSLGNSDYIQGLNAYPLDRTKMRLWNDQNIGPVDKSVNWFAIGF